MARAATAARRWSTSSSIYDRAGFELSARELPDYLPVLLEYLSCRDLAETRVMLADCAHICDDDRPLADRSAEPLCGGSAGSDRYRGRNAESISRRCRQSGDGSKRSIATGSSDPAFAWCPRLCQLAHWNATPLRPRGSAMLSADYREHVPLRHLPLCLPRGSADRQPDPVRSGALHMEEQFVANVAQGGNSGSARTCSTTA